MQGDDPKQQSIPLSSVAAVGTGVMLVLHALILLGVAFVLVNAVPYYQRVYADARIDLPGLSLLLITMSDCFRRYWSAALPGAALLLALDGMVYWLLARRRASWSLSAFWFLAATVLLGFLAVFFFVVPLLLPLVQLNTGIESGG